VAVGPARRLAPRRNALGDAIGAAVQPATLPAAPSLHGLRWRCLAIVLRR